MIFIHYIYKYTPTYQVTLPSCPTRETKYQIGMALCGARPNEQVVNKHVAKFL